MRIRNSSFFAAAALGAALLMTSAVGLGAGRFDAAKIQELRKEEDGLTRELAKVKSGTDIQEQKAMQSHWSMMRTTCN